jgi:peptidyl-dipeptidase A
MILGICQKIRRKFLFFLLLSPVFLPCEITHPLTLSNMPLQDFLETFLPKVQKKSKQLNVAMWILETTGSKDAAMLSAELSTEMRLLFNDKEAFEKLVAWDKDPSIIDPVLKRTINVLLRSFKPNLAPKELLEKLSYEESNLSLLYSNFRPVIDGKPLSENEILDILKKETNVEVRKRAWEASKEVGKILSPYILSLVKIRNDSAKSLGYKDYFSMQLELQEVQEKELFELLDHLSQKSDSAYVQLIETINKQTADRFHVSQEMVGPWAWSDPFCQEDPLNTKELDGLLQGLDIIATAKQFYGNMNLPVETILERSDNFERPGKNQHAFCINMDREGDVRTLNNIQPTIRWLETVFHELGHGVYELGFSNELPWLLKEPPHMITTEAIALFAGRQVYRTETLKTLGIALHDLSLREKAEKSLRRRQLIFSRWVLVMTYFERELYGNPDQDLNKLWWSLVERFQKIKCSGSSSGCDWAAKYHIGGAPVYYYSYLLGELFASSIEKKIDSIPLEKRGKFLKDTIFKPGNRLPWDSLIKQFTGEKLSADDWLSQFAS